MTSIRPAAVAGSFYPAGADELSALLGDCFNKSPLGPSAVLRSPTASIIAGLVPHAGPIYSGPCAAHLYSQLAFFRAADYFARRQPSRARPQAALSPWSRWQSPANETVVDDRLGDDLLARVKFLARDADAHAEEHSIEIQLPFLHRVLGKFEFVPISLSYLSIDECAELGGAIAAACKAQATANIKTTILASSDLSHYLSPAKPTSSTNWL